MTLNLDVQSLRSVPMFAGVDPARLRLLAFSSERLSYDEGTALFRQNDVSDAAYLVLEGRVEVWLERDGRRVKLAELGSGALVGEMGVLSDRPRSATVTAGAKVLALRIGRELFFDLLRQFPQMSLSVMRELARRGSEAVAGRSIDGGAKSARVAQ